MYEGGKEAKDEATAGRLVHAFHPHAHPHGDGYEGRLSRKTTAPYVHLPALPPVFWSVPRAEGFPYSHVRLLPQWARLRGEDGRTGRADTTGGAGRRVFLNRHLLVGSGAVCDSRYKFFQAVGRYLNVPVYIVESPAGGQRESLAEGAHERTVQFLVKEYKQLVTFLEKFLGKKMDWDKIGEIQGTKELDTVWWETNELRKAQTQPDAFPGFLEFHVRRSLQGRRRRRNDCPVSQNV